MRRVMVNSVGFILGFSVVFIALGAAATELGQVLGMYKHTLARSGGRGHHYLWAAPDGDFQDQGALHRCAAAQRKGQQHSDWRVRDRLRFRLRMDALPGPDSDRYSDSRQRTGHGGKGILLLAVYSLGLAVPFLLTSLLMERFLKFYSRFRSHMHAMEVSSGRLMIALGVLLVIGRFTLISSWLSFLNRFAL